MLWDGQLKQRLLSVIVELQRVRQERKHNSLLLWLRWLCLSFGEIYISGSSTCRNHRTIKTRIQIWSSVRFSILSPDISSNQGRTLIHNDPRIPQAALQAKPLNPSTVPSIVNFKSKKADTEYNENLGLYFHTITIHMTTSFCVRNHHFQLRRKSKGVWICWL